ncbi:MAG: radical SAM protein [bacterium]
MKSSIKKIMLINVPVTRPKDFSADVLRVSIFFPLGLAYIAATLESVGKYKIKVIDALAQRDLSRSIPINGGESLRYGLTNDEVAQEIIDYSPDVIGISCLFSATQWDMANVFRIAKEIDKDIITVAGGADAGANAKSIIDNFPHIDFVVIGEGEETITRLLEAISNKTRLSELNGIAFRENGRTQLIPKSNYIDDLDTVSFPARHMFNMDSYLSKAMAHSTFKRTPFTQMVTSRGCPLKCTFCALGNHWGKRQRLRSAKNVLSEIEELISVYGIKEIHFEDDNLTADKTRAAEIFDGIVERGYDIVWNLPSGIAVYTLDDEILEKMKASGCYSVSLAIESGNRMVLDKLMKKPVNLKLIPKLVKKIRELGMDARGFFIIGYPGETKETIRETIEFAKSLELDWTYFFMATPLPHTEMWKICIKNGYINEEDFDPIRSYNKAVIRTPEFDPEYIMRTREEAIIDLNFKNNPNLEKYDINKAIADFNDVVTKYPNFDFANYYLGEAYLKKGDKDMAIQAYKNTLKANKLHHDAMQRLKEQGIDV